jgi:PHD/YefM family antitoxin component YafN of YafNO toxin-antitoxin module
MRGRRHGHYQGNSANDHVPESFGAISAPPRKTKRALVLTVNGKAAAVAQDAEAYQQLLDSAAEASAAEGIRQGLEDVANGRTRPAREVLDEIRAEYDIPR